VGGVSPTHVAASVAVAVAVGVGGWTLLVLNGSGPTGPKSPVAVKPKVDTSAVVAVPERPTATGATGGRP